MAKKKEPKKKTECKGCGKPFTVLKTHLNQSKCIGAYSNEDLEKEQAQTNKERKAYKKNYRKEHSQKINEYQRVYKNENRQKVNENKKTYRMKRKMNMTSEERILAFKKAILDGPNFTCYSCKRSLFKTQVKTLNQNDVSRLKAKLKMNIVSQLKLHFKKEVIFCHNCVLLIRKSKIPKIHFSNGLELERVPEELNLKDLEQQLIARSLLFMKVKKLPTSRMKAMVDKVISVPLEEDDVSKTISALPRHPDDAKIVAVQLKRKLQMKNSHLQEYIRPAKCIKAVLKLKELGNPFYQDVTINENFMEREKACNFDQFNNDDILYL